MIHVSSHFDSLLLVYFCLGIDANNFYMIRKDINWHGWFRRTKSWKVKDSNWSGSVDPWQSSTAWTMDWCEKKQFTANSQVCRESNTLSTGRQAEKFPSEQENHAHTFTLDFPLSSMWQQIHTLLQFIRVHLRKHAPPWPSLCWLQRVWQGAVKWLVSCIGSCSCVLRWT